MPFPRFFCLLLQTPVYILQATSQQQDMRWTIAIALLLLLSGIAQAQCRLGKHLPLWQTLVRSDDPAIGPDSADVVVVEYFDPNCPHCKRLYPALKEVVSEYGLAVRFIFKPIPLWVFSLDQVAALLEANRQGRFEALLALQYREQQRGGLPREKLLALAAEAGLDTVRLQQTLDEKQFLKRMLEDRQQAVEAGIRGVPTLIIGGRLAEHDYSDACLRRLIEQAITQQQQQ